MIMFANGMLGSLPNIIWVIKSRRMRWAGHVARISRNVREKGHMEDPNVDGRIILNWILRNRDGVGGGMNWIDLA